MIILHAGGFNDTVFLWGETPAGEQLREGKTHRASGKATPAPAYPFDAGFEALTAALKHAGVRRRATKNRCEHVAIWLPTRGDHPIPSSPLIAEPVASRAKPRLAPWSITGYPLVIDDLEELLCACAGKELLAPGVTAGADLAWWTEALRLAGSMVARQQYLPGLITQGKEYRARWEPVFLGNDAERIVALAKAMPPAVRALSDASAQAAPEAPAVELAKAFVASALDAIVRESVFQPPPKRARSTKMVTGAHDAWLDGLRARDGLLAGDEKDLADLAAQVEEWRRPIAVSAASPLRLCFRLEEPQAADAARPRRKAKDSWSLRYLLQPIDDPSLLIPVADVWRGRKTAALKRIGDDAREHLLASLGQAAAICPLIADSLRAAEPAGQSLDIAGAHAFLTETAVSLEQAGFGVMLPAWWTGKGTKLRLGARASVKTPAMKGGGGLSLDEIVHVDWQLALDGKKLTLRELESLAALKAPLVRMRGQWLEVGHEEIKSAIDFLKKRSASSEISARDLVHMALGAHEAPIGMAIDGLDTSGWIARLLEQLDDGANLDVLAPPTPFHGVLRPYQLRGYSWLAFLRRWGLGACLADDMGLGKTVQALALVQRDRARGERRPVLLLCPTSVVNNWQKEAARFTPELPVLVHHGVGRKKEAAFQQTAAQHAIVISSYGLVLRDSRFLREVPWAGVILDEAQNVKNPVAKQTRAVRSLEADYRIALTGTPVENNVGDLWSLMEFLNPGLLGTQAEFKRSFFMPIQTGRDPDAAERLKRITGPFILRRLKTDKNIIDDLPDKLEMKVFCSLTNEQASLYAAVLKDVDEALSQSEGIQRKGVVLATLSKLKQVCNHPAQFLGDNSAIPDRSGKLARLTEMLEEIRQVKERTLVFSQFAEMGAIVQRHLQETFGREVLFLHGGVTKVRRDRMVERFQSDDGPSVFVLSLKAGGTGLNLTGANHVFHFDRWWNPAVEDQATDRAFRIGQTRAVQVHKFLCAGTVEEMIDEMIERKQAVAKQVVGAGEGWLTELSNKELKDIFALRKDAVSA